MSSPRRDVVTGSTHVRMRPLHMRAEGGSWIVGRVDTGDFIALPPAGYRAITLLSEGGTVDETRARLRDETGSDIDVAGFVSALVDQGFVAELDGQLLAHPPAPTPTFPWLRQRHVGWLLHPLVALAAGAAVLVATIALVLDPSLMPSYRDLLWSDSGGAVILGNAAIGWTLVFLHELAHLLTARAAGVPGRVSFGTRLQFLVMQTDVSGVWAAPRRVRLTVYLAGIALNLVVFAAAVLVLATVDLEGLVRGLVSATGLLSLMVVPFQLLVFMRTDVYFVIQDVAGCANLYADGSAFARYLTSRMLHWLRRTSEPPANPIRRLRASEGRAVRLYTVLLVCGTVACLSAAVMVTLPVGVTLLAGAAHALVAGGTAAEVFDAAAVLFTSGLGGTLWCRVWWRRHGHRVLRWLGQASQRLVGRR